MNILVFGNSITQGFYDHRGGWVQRIANDFHFRDEYTAVFNLGISGNTTNDVIKRFDNETAARNSENLIVVFSVGVNDALIGGGKPWNTVDQYAKNIQELIAQARKFTDKIVVVSPSACVDERTNPVAWGDYNYQLTRIREFDAATRNVCENENVKYIDILNPLAMAQLEREVMPDGVHPNDDGHELIAKTVKPELEKML